MKTAAKKWSCHFISIICLAFAGASCILASSRQFDTPAPGSTGNYIVIASNFPNGGGKVRLTEKDPVTLRVIPHDEGGAGWSKVWFHFRFDGVKPGQDITIELEKGEPTVAAVAKQIVYSNDGKNYSLINAGTASPDGKLFVYTHRAQSEKIWFAYHFPYTTSVLEQVLIPSLKRTGRIKILELTKSRKGRSVVAIDFNPEQKPKKYGIWIQARAHAFESGASWLAHYLAEWLASDDSLASGLRTVAAINILPIVDLDGVEEGRTGKNALPYDHGRSWTTDEPYWPEIKAIQLQMKNKARQSNMDFFLDIHGPGGGHHPFFIVPFENDLPFKDQQSNRAAFFEVLNAKPLEQRIKGEQSMIAFHYSARSKDKFEPGKGTPPQWATVALNKHIIAMTLETNMNSPLSVLEGYQKQAHVLGAAIANYFLKGLHKK